MGCLIISLVIFDILHFSDYWNQCFFTQLPMKLIEWKMQSKLWWSESMQQQKTGILKQITSALVPFKIPWTLALSSNPAHVSTVSCVAIASEDASSAKVVAQCTPKSRGGKKNIYFWVPAWYLFWVQMLRTVQTQIRKEEVLLVLEEEVVEVLW